MVFLDTPLEEMLDTIMAIKTPSVVDIIKPAGVMGVLNYQRRYEWNLKENITDKPHVLERLLFEPSYPGRIRLSAVVMLFENSFYRGYEDKKGIIEISYFFGRKGVLFHVQDTGKGFDVEMVLEGFKNGDPQKGIHFKTGGTAFNTLNLPEYEAFVESSQIQPTGTKVSLKYKY